MNVIKEIVIINLYDLMYKALYLIISSLMNAILLVYLILLISY
jgi:hypothetical protein